MNIALYIKILFLALESFIFLAYLYILIKIKRAERKSHLKIHRFWSNVVNFNTIFMLITFLVIGLMSP